MTAAGAESRRALAGHPHQALGSQPGRLHEEDRGSFRPSPLGRGFLTGAIRSFDDLAADDWRRSDPRFQRENFERNLDVVERIHELAAGKGCTAAQLALAWVLSQGQDIVPIPGTPSPERLEENAAAARIELSREDLARIGDALPRGFAAGERYPAESMALLNG